MVDIQLGVAIALATSAIFSVTILYLNRVKEGEIKLPTTQSEFAEDEAFMKRSDPFDVVTPDDLSEGQPIEEEVFWGKMRLRKLLLSLLLAISLAIETACLSWAAVMDDKNATAFYVLRVLSHLYTLTLAVISINQIPHFESIVHISALTFAETILLFVTSIIPSADYVTLTQDERSMVSRKIQYAIILLEFTAFMIASTIPRSPPRHYPPGKIYSNKIVIASTNTSQDNVCGIITASVWSTLLFSYTTKVVMLGRSSASLEIGDLPIVPADMRATALFTGMKRALSLPVPLPSLYRLFKIRKGSGWELLWRLVRLNKTVFAAEMLLSAAAAVLYYGPAFFLEKVVKYLEDDPLREDKSWGLIWAVGLFGFNALGYLVTGQLWSLSSLVIQVRLRTQLNSVLFAKTLVRKDVASSAAPKSDDDIPHNLIDSSSLPSDTDSNMDIADGEFSSKAQVMTLMTTDVDRCSEFSTHMFTLVDAPIEIIIGTIFLYNLLGVSCFFGLAVSCIFLPLNHFAGKVVVGAQENLMKARDERVSLMNEILGGIRMLKFMAWERSFEARVLEIRKKEMKYQRLNYIIETLWNGLWSASPILVTLISFWHFTVIRKQVLTPSIAFTSITVFSEMKFALNALPETLINMIQSLVSLRRIEKYLQGAEVSPVPHRAEQSQIIALQSATITWPQDRSRGSRMPSAAPTPRHKFVLVDLSLRFPEGELSLICGKLGSGKTLLLLSLLGEADLLAGQIMCPRSPPDALATFADQIVPQEEWVLKGVCAYVPQAAWLRNASIKDNILFSLPYDEERYQKTLEMCALRSDLEILEDGDESEIGERGVNLSGGQKARVSLARAVYSRASLLLLDDVLSAVDAHTAHHLYYECLKGDLMQGRTIILVSHHVQLCAPGASYVVALDNGRVQFAGDRDLFQQSCVIDDLSLSEHRGTKVEGEESMENGEKNKSKKMKVEEPNASETDTLSASESSTIAINPEANPEKKKPPRRLIEEETRAVGRVNRNVWITYISAFGTIWAWALVFAILALAALSPVGENWWLNHWSSSSQEGAGTKSPIYYIAVYAAITGAGLVVTTIRWLFIYNGSIRASQVLYKRLLETVLFANIRFHDTVSRGRLLNRFGKDFEGIDSSLANSFGRGLISFLSVATTLVTISYVGGLPFILAMVALAFVYYNFAKHYGQTSRDMRRLDSVTRSPLYSIYGETIAGVTVLRAFGASSKFLRDMLRCVDTNTNPYYWMWGVNRWLSVRFNLLSSGVIGVTALVAVLTPSITASLAGFTLAFAATFTNDILFVVRRFVTLEQAMVQDIPISGRPHDTDFMDSNKVALERVKEYTDLDREAPEFLEPRPPASWPSHGGIECKNLVIRYAPELPDVLHNLNFDVQPGEKIGILGRTGSGKSTLALSFFRFVEATEGIILVDGIDIAKIGLTDLRTKLTIIPQDPTIMSGTLRSTIDVFDEYQDAEIFEALRRVHLIPSSDNMPEQTIDTVNANVFRDLDSPVSEGGDNFSTGEKQLLCMARAILKRSKVLVMDEATASVDYTTDELIGKTIRHEFSKSTILTIAHRLRTVIDYDRVMLLEQGSIVEFDRPAILLADSSSKFSHLCRATGTQEFSTLKKLAGLATYAT